MVLLEKQRNSVLRMVIVECYFFQGDFMNSYNKKMETLITPHINAMRKALEISKLGVSSEDIGPFVPYIFDEYESSKIKLMFVGQQTNGGPSIKDLIDQKISYPELFEDWVEFKHNDASSKSHYNSPFWNFIHKVCKEIGINKLGFVWSNIVKFESNNSCPRKEIYEIGRKFFNTMPLEIKAVEPDMVVFLTGPNYDWAIKDAFPEVFFSTVRNLPIRQFSEVNNFPAKKCFRLHHPRYLRTYSENNDTLVRAIAENYNKWNT